MKDLIKLKLNFLKNTYENMNWFDLWEIKTIQENEFTPLKYALVENPQHRFLFYLLILGWVSLIMLGLMALYKRKLKSFKPIEEHDIKVKNIKLKLARTTSTVTSLLLVASIGITLFLTVFTDNETQYRSHVEFNVFNEVVDNYDDLIKVDNSKVIDKLIEKDYETLNIEKYKSNTKVDHRIYLKNALDSLEISYDPKQFQ